MQNVTKRIVSFALALVLVLSLIPTQPVSAQEQSQNVATTTAVAEETDAPLAQELIASGTCGNDLTWTLDGEGTLTISGTGAMDDYTGSSSVPWNDYKSQIKLIKLGSGVTTIGSRAFYFCKNLTAVTIPDTVRKIGEYSFYCCSVLKSVTMAEGVTTIGEGAFNACESLTEAVIPDSVTNIGAEAFYGCRFMTKVTMGSGIAKVGDAAFSACDSLTGVYITDIASWCRIDFGTIGANPLYIAKKLYVNGTLLTSLQVPEDVTTIHDWTFGFCESLTSVTIPDTVTRIGSSAFRSCTGLKELSVPGSVTDIGAFAFFYCTGLEKVMLNEGTAGVGIFAFDSCTSLTDVYYSGTAEQWAAISIGSDNEPLLNATLHTDETKQTPDGFVYESAEDGTVSIIGYAGTAAELEIPAVIDGKSVTDIVYAAFARYTGLTDVTIPDSVVTIGDSAFYGCSNLSSVHIGSGVTTIADDAFTQCTGLTSVTIPDNVITIGVDAFYNCSNLTSVTIGKGVTAIDGGAFYHCNSLKGIWIHEDNPVYSSDRNGMLYNKDKTQLIQAPGGVVFGEIPEGVTTILGSAFRARINLSGVVIPSSVTAIDSGAFFFCLNLTDVYYTGTAEQWAAIALDADGNDPLLNATMHYRSGACGENLRWTLDDTGTLTISGTGAMENYGQVGSPWYDYRNEVNDVVIEDGVTTIGSGAFSYVDLKSVIIGKDVTVIGDYAFMYCGQLSSVTIGNNVSVFGGWAFYGCTELTSIYIPDSVIDIGPFAFAGSGLTSVDIPDGVTTIGQRAFDCDNLVSVVIGDGLTTVDDSFPGNSLTGIWVSENNTTFASDEYGVFYNKSMTKLIKVPGAFVGNYTLRDGVTTIGIFSFGSCTGLKSIMVPNSLTTIEGDAIVGCSSLTDVYYTGTAEQWAAISIGSCNDPLLNATMHYRSGACGENLRWTLDDTGTLTISGTGAMPSFAESDIPWADYRSQIRDVVIADGVTSICAYAFYDCYELLSVRIPVSVTEIGDGAFFACSSLKEIAIPEGVTAIGEETFCYCTGLVSVTIPRSVTVIADYAFSTCLRLTDVYYTGKAFRWETISIGTDNDALTGATLHAAAYEPCQITEHPADQLTGYMETARFTVAASDAATYRWQFRRNAEDSWRSTTLSGYKTATLSVTMTTGRNGYQYRCVVTGMDGSVLYSDEATLTMDAKVEITGAPADAEGLEGSLVPFTVAATDVRSYRWYYRRNESDTWHTTAMKGYVTDALQVLATPAREGYQYRCKLTGVDGSVTYTEPATLHVIPVILTQPADGAGAIGETVRFHVEAQNVTEIQWLYRRSAEDAWSPTKMEGNQTASLKVGVTAGREGYQYMAKITNTDGNLVYSDVVTLYLAPSVTQQPESVAAEIGSAAQFCVAADNVVAYQWQYSRDGAAWSNTKAEGNKTSAITVTATAGNHGYQYRCKLTGMGGSVVYTDAATLTTYRPLLIEIIAHPSNRSAEEGKTVKFATVVDGDVQSYCWQYYDTAAVEWVNASYSGFDTNIMSIVMTQALHGCRFRCVVTDTNGNQLVTDEATLTLKTS